MSLKKPVAVRAKPSKTDAAKAFAGKSEELTRVNANIRVDLHKALKVRSAEEGVSIRNLIEAWIEGWPKIANK